MKYHGYLILLITILVFPVTAVDTSNWVNATSDNGIYFELPPFWAWDPMDQTTVAIRSEKSDAVLLISSVLRVPQVPGETSDDMATKAKNQLSDFHVTSIKNVTFENETVTAWGTTESGLIINLTERFTGNHTRKWVSEYSDSDARKKYADIIVTIIDSTTFNQTAL